VYNLDEIQEIAKKLMIRRKVHNERELGSVFYHGERVAKTCILLREKIMPGYDVEDTKLVISSWFHDVSKGIEPHNKYGSIVTREALKDIIEAIELNEICELIELHCIRRPNKNSYTEILKILQDADLIDHYGVYEIWMNIQYQAHTNGSIKTMIKYYSDEFQRQITQDREKLNHSIAREIFDEKIAFENLFIERLRIEGSGSIVSLSSE